MFGAALEMAFQARHRKCFYRVINTYEFDISKDMTYINSECLNTFIPTELQVPTHPVRIDVTIAKKITNYLNWPETDQHFP